jgi:hypothetical protein
MSILIAFAFPLLLIGFAHHVSALLITQVDRRWKNREKYHKVSILSQLYLVLNDRLEIPGSKISISRPSTFHCSHKSITFKKSVPQKYTNFQN